MKLFAAALAGFALFAAVPAQSASLCNCCAAGTPASCATACATVKPADKLCIPVVDFTADPVIGPGQNPLYGISLKTLDVSNASASQLEMLRRMLETSRRAAEKDRKAALKDFAAGKMNSNAAAALARRYDRAMINYYLGMKAFQAARHH
jgi:hypothetical protein